MSDYHPDEMKPLPPNAAAIVEEHVEREHGYLSWLETGVETVERGRVVLTIPWDEKLTNADGTTIHGGVAATLVDTAGGIAQRTVFEDPASGGVATVNLTVNYLRPAEGDLRAVADVVRSGRSIGVSEMRVESTDGSDASEVVVAQGSFRLFRE